MASSGVNVVTAVFILIFATPAESLLRLDERRVHPVLLKSQGSSPAWWNSKRRRMVPMGRQYLQNLRQLVNGRTDLSGVRSSYLCVKAIGPPSRAFHRTSRNPGRTIARK